MWMTIFCLPLAYCVGLVSGLLLAAYIPGCLTWISCCVTLEIDAFTSVCMIGWSTWSNTHSSVWMILVYMIYWWQVGTINKITDSWIVENGYAWNDFQIYRVCPSKFACLPSYFQSRCSRLWSEAGSTVMDTLPAMAPCVVGTGALNDTKGSCVGHGWGSLSSLTSLANNLPLLSNW